jgi:hypothetical protein
MMTVSLKNCGEKMIKKIKDKNISDEELLKNEIKIGDKEFVKLKEDTFFDIKCSVCDKAFQSTKNKNMSYFLTCYLLGDVLSNKKDNTCDVRSVHQVAIQYLSECPNCGHEEIICYEKVDRKIMGELYEGITYDDYFC